MTNDICGCPDLRPKDELVGHCTEDCQCDKRRIRNFLRSGVLLSTDVYRGGRFIQIDGVRNELVVTGNEFRRDSFDLIKRDDVRTL